MDAQLNQIEERDRQVWDACARTYEQRIVGGHPDVTAYEAFEEDLLDRVLRFLMRDRGEALRLYDVGCGSARLHRRFGLQLVDETALPQDAMERVRTARQLDPGCAYDPLFADRLRLIDGLDFSAEMIDLAREKLTAVGLGRFVGSRLKLIQGSAYDLTPLESDPLPVVVSVCNSIGVMQGPMGAVQLFQSMRRSVEQAQGIAIISAYRGEAVPSFALGNYESTMDVCGQPRWLEPDTYATNGYRQIPWGYKRAHDADPGISVDVVDGNDQTVAKGHRLTRNPKLVDETVRSCHITTWTDYESRWYPFAQFDEWIEEHWAGCKSYHLAGKSLDSLRGEPAQLAILDPARRLEKLLERWL